MRALLCSLALSLLPACPFCVGQYRSVDASAGRDAGPHGGDGAIDAATADAAPDAADAATPDRGASDGAAADRADAESLDGGAGDVRSIDTATPDTAHADVAGPDLAAEDGALTDVAASDDAVEPSSAEVLPVYPLHAGWNQYIARDPERDPYHQDDADCDVANVHAATDCLHAGMMRQVRVPGETCQGLELREALMAFDWACSEEEGEAIFINRDLLPGMGLGHLIGYVGDQPGFLPNEVEVWRAGQMVASSEPASWWATPVERLGVENQTYVLNETDRIYWIWSPSPTTHTLAVNIDADGIALVVAPGHTMQWGSGLGGCDLTSGAYLEDAPTSCLVASGGWKRLWIEGDFEGADLGGYGVLLVRSTLATVRDTRVAHFRWDGLRLSESTAPSLSQIECSDNSWGFRLSLVSGARLFKVHAHDNRNGGGHLSNARNSVLEAVSAVANLGQGLSLNDGGSNVIRRLAALANGATGLALWDSEDNLFAQVVVAGNKPAASSAAIDVKHGRRNTFLQILSLANEGAGMLVDNSSSFTRVLHMSTLLNAGPGLIVNSAVDSELVHLLAVRNQDSGLLISGGPGNRTFQLTAYANEIYGIRVATTYADNDFSGTLRLGAHQNDCEVTNYAATNLQDDCKADPATFEDLDVQEIDICLDFVGAVAQYWIGDDQRESPRNFADLDLSDWTLPALDLRSWGHGGADLRVAEFGACTSGSCHLWDARLTQDSYLMQLATPFDSPYCPVDGNQVVPTSDGMDYLVDAVELPVEGSGNGDGLCQSNERCLYAPVPGAYFGHGDFVADPCSFVNGGTGGVTGVQLYRLSQLGL